MRILFLIFACFLLIDAAPSPPEVSQVEITVDDAPMQRRIVDLEGRIIEVFNEMFQPAAAAAAEDDKQRSIISRAQIKIDPYLRPENCGISPHADRWPGSDTDQPEIVISRSFEVLDLYVTQALWIEIVRGFEPDAAARILEYVRQSVDRSHSQIQARCQNPQNGGLFGDQIFSYARQIGMTDAEYEAAMQSLQADPATMELGNQVGAGFPFVLLHELAHHAYGHTLAGRQSEPDVELVADAFAVKVFRAGGLSPTLALGPFLIFLESDEREPRSRLRLACRALAVLQSDDRIDEHLGQVGIPQFVASVEKMRQAFISTFEGRC